VAKLTASSPKVDATPDLQLSSDAVTIELEGTGFVAQKGAVNVTFESTGMYQPCVDFTPATIDPVYVEDTVNSYADPGLNCIQSGDMTPGTDITGVVQYVLSLSLSPSNIYISSFNTNSNIHFWLFIWHVNILDLLIFIHPQVRHANTSCSVVLQT